MDGKRKLRHLTRVFLFQNEYFSFPTDRDADRDAKPTSQFPAIRLNGVGSWTLNRALVLPVNSLDGSVKNTRRVIPSSAKMQSGFDTSVSRKSNDGPVGFGQTDFDRFDEPVLDGMILDLGQFPPDVLAFIGYDV